MRVLLFTDHRASEILNASWRTKHVMTFIFENEARGSRSRRFPDNDLTRSLFQALSQVGNAKTTCITALWSAVSAQKVFRYPQHALTQVSQKFTHQGKLLSHLLVVWRKKKI